MGYRLVHSGEYSKGKIITSILRENDLLAVVVSCDKNEKREGLPLWCTNVFYEGKKIDKMIFHGYPIDASKHLVSKWDKGKFVTTTQQHEKIVEFLLEDLVNNK